MALLFHSTVGDKYFNGLDSIDYIVLHAGHIALISFSNFCFVITLIKKSTQVGSELMSVHLPSTDLTYIVNMYLFLFPDALLKSLSNLLSCHIT